MISIVSGLEVIRLSSTMALHVLSTEFTSQASITRSIVFGYATNVALVVAEKHLGVAGPQLGAIRCRFCIQSKQ